MATDKMLKKAATELNDVMGLTPSINVKGATDVLIKGIKAAAKHITPDDEFSEETEAVINEILGVKAEKEVPAKKGKKAPVVVEEDDDDDDDDDAEEIEIEDDDDYEEVPAPKKSAKKVVAPEPVKKGKKAVVVEEDDDDDDDEPVAPVKKGKKVIAPEPVAPAKKGKKAVVVEEDDDDAEEAPKKKKAPAFVRSEFNRLDCVLITLKEKKPKTIAEWITKANALCIAKGIKDNELQTKHLVVNYGAALKHLDLDVKVPSK